METALTIVRLRWALTFATLRKSAWQTVGYVIAIVFGVSAVVGTGALAFFLGGPLMRIAISEFGLYAFLATMHVIVILLGSFAMIMVAFVQLMLIGDGSTMSPKRFTLYGIPDVRLQLGVVLAGLSGIPAICGTLALMLWSLSYRWMGADVVIAAIVAAPLTIITMMSIAKLIISTATTLVTSKRGKALLYVITMTVFVFACQLPNLITSSNGAGGPDVTALSRVTAVLSWTPLGAAFQLPFDAFSGSYGLLAARILILALTWALCFAGCVWCLRRDRLTAGAAERTVTAKGIGAFGWMPDSVSGALSARLFTYLKRDPRQMMLFIMPVLFVVVFSFQANGLGMQDGGAAMVWQSLIWGGWLMPMLEGNGLAYDGRGFTMEVLAGVRGHDDRVARVRVFGVICAVYLTVMALVCLVITGDWRTSGGLLTGLTFLVIGISVSLSALGLAEVVNCSFMYPVPSMDKPFSTPQGRAMAQGFFPFIHLFGSAALMLPTGIVAAVLALSGGLTWYAWYWVLMPVGLVNGLAAVIIGSWLGGKLLDARAIRVVHTLDSFAALQR
ncbi:ABC transporter permease [Bifidobacterium goeldii]|uniref:ABC transporter permease n=1 Tax=Bifidobacterium goeldii TaxID=2306975 RepID=A0A430FFX7_9BIFI|nr:ABC transporter permease [Bifidobacterium goeldii]RSX51784.1 ABC transporter permease [Bifidobacterium goeldii]